MPIFPQQNGSDPTIVHVPILYSSFAAFLLTVFIIRLGKRWFDHHAQIEVCGLVIDRSRHRQRKMNGMIIWHFDIVMVCTPLTPQAALLLSCALSNYLFIDEFLSSVVIGFTTFYHLFCLLFPPLLYLTTIHYKFHPLSSSTS